ncbi:GNAT family N-acetyltransferase [Bacillus sp. SG-1]|uniref:GNAT family N-acetyltransferase n=1 Tax=Bacillus sp. SG-1 TaxID=161544 RepID=UPI00015436A3|nr:GNAT family N-acetyltransferase [Bacillus sp. SG-1]EDL65547.1 hypothetical protein BSG1_00575 [Bacillus sp. SG-1]
MDENTAAGSIWLAKIPEDTGYIYDIHINPDQQGKGHDKQAMKEIGTIAKELDFTKIELYVFGHNKVAKTCMKTGL